MDNEYNLRMALVRQLREAIADAEIAARHGRDWRDTRIATHVEGMRRLWADLDLPEGIELCCIKAPEVFLDDLDLAGELVELAMESSDDKNQVLEKLHGVAPGFMLDACREKDRPVVWWALDGVSPFTHEPEAGDSPETYSLEIWGRHGLLSSLNASDVFEWLTLYGEPWIRVLERNQLDPIREFWSGPDGDCAASLSGDVVEPSHTIAGDAPAGRRRGRPPKIGPSQRELLVAEWQAYSSWLEVQDPKPPVNARVKAYSKATGRKLEEIRKVLDDARKYRCNLG